MTKGGLFGEIWVVSSEFPDYAISSKGKVKRLTRGCGTWPGRILKPSITHGYYHVSLSTGNAVTNRRVHVMVCEAFNGPRPSEEHDAAHNDGNRLNNTLSNLSWKTKVANQHDRVKHGTDIRGIEVHGAKLSEQDVKEIRIKFSQGVSMKSLASDFSVDYTNIWQICKRNTWRHVK